MWTVLAGFTVALGPLAMFNLYFMPYWINVMWLDAVTYLHHHGPEDQQQIPWYRGEVYSFWLAFDHLCIHSTTVADCAVLSLTDYKAVGQSLLS